MYLSYWEELHKMRTNMACMYAVYSIISHFQCVILHRLWGRRMDELYLFLLFPIADQWVFGRILGLLHIDEAKLKIYEGPAVAVTCWIVLCAFVMHRIRKIAIVLYVSSLLVWVIFLPTAPLSMSLHFAS